MNAAAAGFCVDHHIEPIRDLILRSAKNFPEQAFHAIPYNRSADFAGRRDSQPAMPQVVPAAEQYKM